MSKVALALFSVVLSLTGFSAWSAGPSPVLNLDIERYQGLWHQLAAIPASFQEDCVANTTAEYSLLEKGRIKVVNSCDRKHKKRKSSEARARVNKKYGLNSTLEVTFVKIVKWIWPFSGDYWVLYVSDNYDVAIVGHPENKYGWILSRKDALSVDEYKHLHTVLTEQGYDSCDFVLSNTPGQILDADVRLCEIVK